MNRFLAAPAMVLLVACNVDVDVGDNDGGRVSFDASVGNTDAGRDGGQSNPTDTTQSTHADAGPECVDVYDCAPRVLFTAVCISNTCVYTPFNGFPDAGRVDAGIRDAGGATPGFDAGTLPSFDGGLRVFVTRSVFQGDLGGLAGADEKCQLHADAMQLGGTWAAFVSAGAAAAPERMTAAGPWFHGNTKIFNNLANLRTNPLSGIYRDETGAGWGISGTLVALWSGTASGGAVSPYTCSGFSSNSRGTYGTVGRAYSTLSEWVDTNNPATCDRLAHVMCFEQTRLPAAVTVPDTRRRTFVTRSTFDGNLGGLSGADAKCQLAAEANELGGSWKSFLSANGTAAPSRVGGEGPWFHGDTKIFNNLANLRTNPLSGIYRDETGDGWGVSGTVVALWTGTASAGAVSPYTCAGFTSNSRGTYGTVGRAYSTLSEWVDTNNPATCDQVAHLLCFEQ